MPSGGRGKCEGWGELATRDSSMSLSFTPNMFPLSPISLKGERSILLFPSRIVLSVSESSCTSLELLWSLRASSAPCSLLSQQTARGEERAASPLPLLWEDGSPFLSASETRKGRHISVTLGLQEGAWGATLSHERGVIFHFPLHQASLAATWVLNIITRFMH